MELGGVPMNKKLLPGKFSFGVGLIVSSFAVAQIAKVTFFLYITDSAYRNGSIVLYVISWLLLFIGIWFIGTEYQASVRKYATLKFYHESIVEGTKKVAEKVLELGGDIDAAKESAQPATMSRQAVNERAVSTILEVPPSTDGSPPQQ